MSRLAENQRGNVLTTSSLRCNVRHMTGIDLKVRRIRRGVRVTDLAHRMGLKTHSRVSQIEAMREVPSKAAVRYLNALETFPNVEAAASAA